MGSQILEGFRLSVQQRRLWQLEEEGFAPALVVTCRLGRRFPAREIEKAVEALSRKHEILRSGFAPVPGLRYPVQVVRDAPRLVWQMGPDLEATPALHARQMLRVPVVRERDAAWQPEILLAIQGRTDRESRLLIRLPAMLVDVESAVTLVEELSEALASGGVADEAPLQYGQFAEWQASAAVPMASKEEAEALPQDLRRVMSQQLPLARPAAASAETPWEWAELPAPRQCAAALDDLAVSQSFSESAATLAGWTALLARLLGGRELSIGCVRVGRIGGQLRGVVGPFTETVPLHVVWLRGESFRSLALGIDSRLRELADSSAPFGLAHGLEAMREADAPFRFPLAFEYHRLPADRSGQAVCEIEDLLLNGERADLKLTALRRGEELLFRLFYPAGVIAAERAAELLRSLVRVLEQAAAEPTVAVDRLDLVAPEERDRILGLWSGGREPALHEEPLHRWIEARAREQPDAAAVVGESGTLTYGALDRAADRWARSLGELGVGPEAVVAVLMQRDVHLLVALLAVLKAGGAYLPLDPSYPAERLRFMLEDSEARLLLTDPGQGTPGLLGLDCLPVSAFDVPAEDQAAPPPHFEVSPSNLAYLIYTSGSTGRPKAVGVTHGALLRSTAARLDFYREPSERFLLTSSISFDSSVAGLYWTLAQGGTLLLPGPGVERDTGRLARALAEGAATHWLGIPSLWTALLDQADPAELGALRVVMVAGEACRRETWSRHAASLPRTRLVNEYGPTEVTVWSLAYGCDDQAGSEPSLPIGRPIDFVSAYLLGPDLGAAFPGAPGEIHLGGATLARGYLRRPALTATRFVPDPFSSRPGARLYRTGDLARHLPDGRIEFLGRADGQVKIRGHRVELEEVEAILAEHPGVREAAVVAVEPSSTQLELVAFLVTIHPIGDAELRAWAAERLPNYAIPSRFLDRAALPRSPSGKVDRLALASRAGEMPAGAAGLLAPRTPVEEILAGIWREVLRREEIGVDQEFVSLGGHSLLALPILARIRRVFSIDLEVDAVFRLPTITGLAREVEARLGRTTHLARDRILPQPASDSRRLSFAQERLWFLDQLEGPGAVFNCPAVLRLAGVLDLAGLALGLSAIVGRHEALRTVFPATDGQPVARVLPVPRTQLPVVDLSGLTHGACRTEAARLSRAFALRPFDLERGPLLRAAVLRQAPEEHRLLFNLHHIVGDAVSLRVLERELAALYRAQREGRQAELPALPVQYTDFAAWQRATLAGQRLQTELGYWKEQLGTDPWVLEIPTDRPRSPAQSHRGAHRVLRLPAAAACGLRSRARRHNLTFFVALLATFQCLLSRWCRQGRVAVGVPFAGRELEETENLIGLFLNPLVLLADLSDDPEVDELLTRTQATFLGAYLHQSMPFERLVDELAPDRGLGRSPLFQVMLDFESEPVGAMELAGLVVEALPTSNESSKVDLTLFLVEEGEDLVCTLEYNTELIDSSTAERTLQRFQCLAASLAEADGTARCSQLPWIPEQEQVQILRDWAGDAPPLGESWTLVSLLERALTASPDSVALVAGDEHMSRGELEQASRALAGRLAHLGAGAESVIAICADRSLALMVSVVAILRAGAAYLPLDPEEPPARLAAMVGAADPLLILTQRGLEERLSQLGPAVLAVGAGAWSTGEPAEDLLLPGPCDADQLAYLIFTSGSTGRPKGVMTPHRGLVNRLLWMEAALGLGHGDVFLQKTPITFDVSLWELFLPLLVGGRLVLASPGGHRDGHYLSQVMADGGVTIAHFVPSMLSAFLAEPDLERLGSLRWLVASGEALSPESAQQVSHRTGARVMNLYGPTEASVDVSAWSCDGPQGHTVPIGRPICGVRLYVLDPRLELVAAGVPGELSIGGVGLARAYLRQPGMTAERFRPDPWSGRPGERLYRTGDLVRHRPDGALEFLGRLDHQVKIRGVRIELAEIEGCLAGIAGVEEAVVAARPELPPANNLVAYVVPAADAAPTSTALAGALRERLPEPMVPAVYVFLDRLPKTPSGKVDRRALPTPRGRDRETRRGAAPGTPTEELVAEVWRQELAVDRLGAEDSFFELGGHSILATRLVARLRRSLEVDLPLRALFEAPTVASLSREIDRLRGRPGRLPALPVAEPDRENAALPFPLTDVQQAYWVGRSGAFDLGNVSAHGYSELEVAAADLDRFAPAFRRLIDRHAMLRAVFEDGQQRTLSPVPPYELEVEDLRGIESSAREARLEEIRQRMSHQVLAADRWPLFEIRASLLPGGRARLHLSVDGLLSDAWSYQVLIGDLHRFVTDPDHEPPPLEFSFRDYVLAERRLRATPLHERAHDYWWDRLDSLPPAPALPLARNPRSLVQPRFERRSHRLARETWAELRRRAAEHGLTGSGLLVACFSEVLATWSESPRLTLNLTLFNRLPVHPQVDDLVGDFTSTLLLAVEGGEATFVERARGIQRRLWENLDHRYVSGVEILRELARRRKSASEAAMPIVFTSTLNLARPGQSEVGVGHLGELLFSITQTPQVWLDHQVFEEQGSLAFNWDAIGELFPEGLLDDMFAAYCHLLERLAAQQAPWQAENLDLVPRPQLELRQSVNETARPFRRSRLEDLFRDQVARQPAAAAVITPGETLTYRDLDLRSNHVANWLRAAGVEPEEPVAIFLRKGWEQVVAVLGVLKAGASYLPIDPDLPTIRQERLLAASRSRFGLELPGEGQRPPGGERLRWLDIGGETSDAELPPAPGGDRALAYVLYTSGSTGEPKGVMIEHRSVVNRVLDVNERFQIGTADRVLGLTALHHDLSVYDVFGMLLAGAALVLPAAERARDPSHWWDLARAHGVTIWNSVPAFLSLLLDTLSPQRDSNEAPPLRWVFLSGDWIPVALPGRLRSRLPAAQLVSLGGPTETTVWDICYPVTEVDPAWESIPYGRPMANGTYHVLDERLRQRPTWVPGELFIGGIGLARGFLHDEARTSALFFEHPATGERLYRSGDLGRYLPDGSIELLGRVDLQVKVAGQRIELGEVEAAVRRLSGVRHAVVEAVWRGEPRERQRALVAFVVLEEEAELDLALLRRHLRLLLPEAMIPSELVLLGALPLGPTGKVDRRALHLTERPAQAGSRVAAASSETVEQVRRLMAAVLNQPDLGPEDDLLDLGANSIDLIRISNRLAAELGFRPEYDDLFRDPTAAALAQKIDEHGARPREPVEPAQPPAVALPPILLEPEERRAFQESEPGVRRDGALGAAQPLAATGMGEFVERYRARRTRRSFSSQPVDLECLGLLLEYQRRLTVDGEGRRLYPSAGGVYGVQVYVHARPARVRGLEAGYYYYHPGEHSLRALELGQDIDPAIHSAFINRPIFDQAAFSLFLIADLGAFSPLYGDNSLTFALLEAGYLGQLLMQGCAREGLGLCPVGNLEFDRIRPAFRLGSHHQLVHSFLGGAVDDGGALSAEGVRPGALARLLHELRSLSDEEAAELLRLYNPTTREDHGRG